MKFLFLLERSMLIVFWVLLIFGFDTPYTAILTIISAAIHELGHVSYLLILNRKGSIIPIPNISGLRIKIPVLSYREELFCALSGPFANLAAALICLIPFPVSCSAYIKAFAALNIMTMISNLLPIEEYDGYKALGAILGLTVKSNSIAQNILYLTSLIVSSTMCLLTLYIMLKLDEGYWIFAVFFTIMLRTIAKKQKEGIF